MRSRIAKQLLKQKKLENSGWKKNVAIRCFCSLNFVRICRHLTISGAHITTNACFRCSHCYYISVQVSLVLLMLGLALYIAIIADSGVHIATIVRFRRLYRNYCRFRCPHCYHCSVQVSTLLLLRFLKLNNSAFIF